MDTAERIEAARQRLAENRSAALSVRKAAPPCRDCAWSNPRDKAGKLSCYNPALQSFRYDHVTGQVGKDFGTPIRKARADDGICGPEGVLFQGMNRLQRVCHWLSTTGPWPVAAAAIILLATIGSAIITIQGRWS